MKKFIWSIIVLLVLVLIYDGAIALYNYFVPRVSTLPDIDMSPIPIQDKQIKDETDTYTINIIYPETNQDFINQDINNFIYKEIANFKQAITLQTNPVEANWQYTLFIRYDTVYNERTIVSFKFEIEQFLGGAHPTHLIVAKNYNWFLKRIYTIDTAIPNQETLDKIAKVALDYFQNMPKDWELFPEGLAPKIENYQTFNMTPDSCIFYFQEAQIAPYSAGPQQIEIKWSEIQ